jgi:hypothetical protein
MVSLADLAAVDGCAGFNRTAAIRAARYVEW